jgi:anhydro-N-acetylmuramic acid kinase
MNAVPSDTELYIGIISGTSVDAIDCALIQKQGDHIKLLETIAGEFPTSLRNRILKLCSGNSVSLAELGQTDIEIGKNFAATINSLLSLCGIDSHAISAIGSHGQTIFHMPAGTHRFSMQIGDPNTIAEQTGITTVADFRRRDMAAGGQGAPLAPLFHQHYFFNTEQQSAVLNIGGIANLTLLASHPSGTPTGFDTGPGNVLMDSWVRKHTGKPYDASGQWASEGAVLQDLLESMLSEPYLKLTAPKSTGRELFNEAWLTEKLTASGHQHRQQPDFLCNVQRTLLEFTAQTITDAVKGTGTGLPDRLAVCGGGAHNSALMQRLQELLPDVRISSTSSLGLHPDWVEAATFAWLAAMTLEKQPLDCGLLTGSRNPVVLGGVYTGRNLYHWR